MAATRSSALAAPPLFPKVTSGFAASIITISAIRLVRNCGCIPLTLSLKSSHWDVLSREPRASCDHVFFANWTLSFAVQSLTIYKTYLGGEKTSQRRQSHRLSFCQVPGYMDADRQLVGDCRWKSYTCVAIQSQMGVERASFVASPIQSCVPKSPHLRRR